MKYLLCVLAASLFVAVARGDDEEGYLFENRERAGHFRDTPFIEAYQTYVSVFLKDGFTKDRQIQPDNYKNYAPTPENCFNHFDTLKVNEYEIKTFEELVVVDACLGYLFDEVYKTEYQGRDKQSQYVKDNLDQWLKDEKLKSMYENTKIEQLSEPNKKCVANLLLSILGARNEFPDVYCNNHIIQLLNQFSECQGPILSETDKESDTYVSILYRLVQEVGFQCYKSEFEYTNEAVRNLYGKQFISSFILKMTKNGPQAIQRKWPKEVVQLLSAVNGVEEYKDSVNLRTIANYAQAITSTVQPNKHIGFVSRFLKNMSEYATKKLLSKKKSKNAIQDHDGSVAYRQEVDRLCEKFRTSDNEKLYDFSTSFARLVDMLQFPHMYHISGAQFIGDAFNLARETAPVYASIVMCNILHYTKGTIKNLVGNGPKSYKVELVKDTTSMIRWPGPGFY